MTTPLNTETIRKAPKALLHDHLDGGLRPATVLDIAGQIGYDGLPATDVDGLARGFEPRHTAARWSATSSRSRTRLR